MYVIREWYDKKDKDLNDTRGEAYITERNLSAAARQYHEDNLTEHTNRLGAPTTGLSKIIIVKVEYSSRERSGLRDTCSSAHS